MFDDCTIDLNVAKLLCIRSRLHYTHLNHFGPRKQWTSTRKITVLRNVPDIHELDKVFAKYRKRHITKQQPLTIKSQSLPHWCCSHPLHNCSPCGHRRGICIWGRGRWASRARESQVCVTTSSALHSDNLYIPPTCNCSLDVPDMVYSIRLSGLNYIFVSQFNIHSKLRTTWSMCLIGEPSISEPVL